MKIPIGVSEITERAIGAVNSRGPQHLAAPQRRAEEPEIKLPTSIGSLGKAREFQKNIYFCFIDYTKIFDYVDHNKL